MGPVWLFRLTFCPGFANVGSGLPELSFFFFGWFSSTFSGFQVFLAIFPSIPFFIAVLFCLSIYLMLFFLYISFIVS